MVFMCLSLFASGQEKQALLIGTFHFNNPGLDAAQLVTLDVKSEKSKKDIDSIVETIRQFHPSRIFVEYDYHKQETLDLLFTDFLQGKKATKIAETSEIWQVAFKAAAVTGLKQVIGIDYRLNLPGDSIGKVLQENKQEQLGKDINNYVQSVSGGFNNAVKRGAGLLDLILEQNTPESRNRDQGFYTTLLTQAGDKNNFAGADVAAAWYKRNINIFSLIQKSVGKDDQRIVVLMGASHIAMLQKFFSLHPDYTVAELKDLLHRNAVTK